MYKIVFSKRAKNDLEKVNTVYLVSMDLHIKKLSENPRPAGCIKITGSKNSYRIRVGVYRIIYTIEDKILTVNVVKIDHRSSAYK